MFPFQRHTGVDTEGGCVKYQSGFNRRTYLKYKFLVNVPLGDAWLKVRVLQKTQKKFINQLRRTETKRGCSVRVRVYRHRSHW